MRTQEYKKKEKEIMEKCFECYCDNDLGTQGLRRILVSIVV